MYMHDHAYKHTVVGPSPIVPLRSSLTRPEHPLGRAQVIGQDAWVVVPIGSSARPGAILEGTRLTIAKMVDQPEAYELSIRTPVTPHRWKDFDKVAFTPSYLLCWSTGCECECERSFGAHHNFGWIGAQAEEHCCRPHILPLTLLLVVFAYQ